MEIDLVPLQVINRTSRPEDHLTCTVARYRGSHAIVHEAVWVRLGVDTVGFLARVERLCEPGKPVTTWEPEYEDEESGWHWGDKQGLSYPGLSGPFETMQQAGQSLLEAIWGAYLS